MPLKSSLRPRSSNMAAAPSGPPTGGLRSNGLIVGGDIEEPGTCGVAKTEGYVERQMILFINSVVRVLLEWIGTRALGPVQSMLYAKVEALILGEYIMLVG